MPSPVSEIIGRPGAHGRAVAVDELILNLDIRVSPRTVSKYLSGSKKSPPRSPIANWVPASRILRSIIAASDLSNSRHRSGETYVVWSIPILDGLPADAMDLARTLTLTFSP
jgi:hypothetical protein